MVAERVAAACFCYKLVRKKKTAVLDLCRQHVLSAACRMVSDAVAGLGRLDIAINNAGKGATDSDLACYCH
jgi:NAD(P)-dependent dehydrogenase (short-subunit alcohol dehydrogenase family)